MRQDNVIAFALFVGFIVFITAKGELTTYMGFFIPGTASKTASAKTQNTTQGGTSNSVPTPAYNGGASNSVPTPAYNGGTSSSVPGAYTGGTSSSVQGGAYTGGQSGWTWGDAWNAVAGALGNVFK